MLTVADTRVRLEGAFDRAEELAWTLETAAERLRRFSFTSEDLAVLTHAVAVSGPALTACRKRWVEPGVAPLLARVDRAEAQILVEVRRVCADLRLAPPPPTLRGALAALEPAVPLVFRQWVVAPLRVWAQVVMLVAMTGFVACVDGPPYGLPFSLVLLLRLAVIAWQARRVIVGGRWLMIGARRLELGRVRRVRLELPDFASRSRERALVTIEHDAGWLVESLPDALEDVEATLRRAGVDLQLRRG